MYITYEDSTFNRSEDIAGPAF